MSSQEGYVGRVALTETKRDRRKSVLFPPAVSLILRILVCALIALPLSFPFTRSLSRCCTVCFSVSSLPSSHSLRANKSKCAYTHSDKRSDSPRRAERDGPGADSNSMSARINELEDTIRAYEVLLHVVVGVSLPTQMELVNA